MENIETKEVDEATKLWQEFLQKCCEAGQIKFQLSQLEGTKRSMEKQLEVTEEQVRKTAAKHTEVKKQQLQEAKVEGQH